MALEYGARCQRDENGARVVIKESVPKSSGDLDTEDAMLGLGGETILFDLG